MTRSSDLKIAGRTLRLLDSGGDGRPVLFLHGNSGSARLVAPVFDLLSAGPHRLLALDFPGHGESVPSEDPASDYSVPGLAEVLVGAVSQLGLGKYVIVGHSLGGHVATTALPKLTGLAGLMLISAPPVNAPSLPQAFAPDPTGGAMFGERLTEAQVESFAAALLGPRRAADSMSELMMSSIRATDVRFRPALLASIMAGRVGDERLNLETTRVPTCLAFGKHDPFLSADYFEKVRFGAPFRDGLHAFEHSGHSPHLDSTPEFVRLLQQFLSEGASF
jgi:pimeloyl-ACP methyl ester carboxylesterase